MMRVVLALLWLLLARPALALDYVGIPALGHYIFGGLGSDAFTYAGEGAGGCAGDICRGGTCTGTTPTGTCSLTLNSTITKIPADGSFTSVVISYSSFTMSAGTLTIASGTGTQGSILMIRSAGNIAITGGTITMKGKGGVGATGGACASSNAGKAGGNTIYLGGAAGASGNNPGSNGTNGTWAASHTPFTFPLAIGSGGGSNPVSGQTAPADITGWGPATGGTGGGGGGCAASCSGTAGAGGRGGGLLVLEVGGEYSCSGATLTTAGDDGTNGSAGGGAGGVSIFYASIGTDSCTYTVAGGVTAGSAPTNCGVGGNGGSGVATRQRAPL